MSSTSKLKRLKWLKECMHTSLLLLPCNILDKYLHIVLTYLRKIGLKHSSTALLSPFLSSNSLLLFFFCNIAIHVSSNNNTLHLKGIIEKFLLFFMLSPWSSQLNWENVSLSLEQAVINFSSFCKSTKSDNLV